VLNRLALGERVACICDAGTPAISDPGATLVAAARLGGYRVLPVPGASSAVAALSVAGDDGGGAMCLLGFLPARGGERAAALQRLAAEATTQVLFEAPHRIGDLAAALARECGQRPVTVCRELTKQFETVVTLAASDVPAWLEADANRSRGEFVVVVHGLAHRTEPLPDAHDTTLRTLLKVVPLKQAVALAVELTGAPRNRLYERALALKQDS
ncbi:MAG: SAM-dependent methyltransferase, partial [Rhizobacter sp.]|nr:SAM-dependent methyltransferase [Rhizobacter sp.]